jgi:site-specific DNA-adenine methylase
MRYYGGKGKCGKEISEILKHIMKKYNIHNYAEPFCGALGVAKHMNISKGNVDEVNIPGIKCYCNDLDTSLILLWKAVQKKEFKNPHMTKRKWLSLKNSNEISPEKAFAGYGCSYSGIYFSSYFIHNYSSPSNIYENLYKYDLSNIKFSNMDYKKMTKLFEKGGFLIYCDPPYKNTDCLPYSRSKEANFNHNEFLNLIKQWKKMGNIIIISEFSNIPGARCIWKKERKNTICITSRIKDVFIEKLFIL